MSRPQAYDRSQRKNASPAVLQRGPVEIQDCLQDMWHEILGEGRKEPRLEDSLRLVDYLEEISLATFLKDKTEE